MRDGHSEEPLIAQSQIVAAVRRCLSEADLLSRLFDSDESARSVVRELGIEEVDPQFVVAARQRLSALAMLIGSSPPGELPDTR